MLRILLAIISVVMILNTIADAECGNKGRTDLCPAMDSLMNGEINVSIYLAETHMSLYSFPCVHV